MPTRRNSLATTFETPAQADSPIQDITQIGGPLVRAADWIGVCFKIGAVSLGSAGRITLFQNEVVNKKSWLTEEEFRKVVTVSQVLPGSLILSFASYLGYRLTSRLAAIAGVAAFGLTGALLSVLAVGVIDLANTTVRVLFQGFAIGSITMSALYIWTFLKGMNKSTTPNVNTTKRKTAARICLASTIAVGMLFGAPISFVLMIGSFAGFCVEFLI